MVNHYFPFHALGYQCNPFRAVTDAEWVSLAVLPPGVAAVLDAPYLQILGEKGHGKTTLLLTLADRFKRAGLRTAYEHLEVEANRFTTPLSELDVFLLDEAQRLTAPERDRLLKAGLGRLVVAGHEDLSPWFARFGLSLISLELEEVRPGHLAAVVAARLAHFALPGATSPLPVSAEALSYLESTFGADVRQSELALYEAFESIKGDPTVREVGLTTLQAVLAGSLRRF